MVCEAAERAMVHAEDAPRRAPSSVWPRWGRGFGAWKSPQGSLGGRRAASNLPTIIPEGTIFQGTWYGTFMDFLAAVLWGFSVDVSVAKVREIASPVLGRVVPLPATRP
jgi:hypothetical protein